MLCIIIHSKRKSDDDLDIQLHVQIPETYERSSDNDTLTL